MFCVLPVLHACAGKGETPLSDPPFDEICTLSQEEEPLGAINSIDYVSDSTFVLCTESQIYLYDFSGSLIRKIGRMGHARSEYISPRIARYGSDRIVVWDGMQAKFLCYGMDGEYLGETTFDTGVSDFLVDGDCLLVYTANKKSDRCIVKLDLASGETETQEFMPVGSGHHVLARWVSRAPMALENGVLWCMPKNKLDIYRSDRSEVIHLNSDSFKAADIDDPQAVIADREKMEEYLHDNSFVLAVHPMDRVVHVLAAEGYLRKTNMEMDRTHRYYAAYSYDKSTGKVKKLARFPQASFSPEQVMVGPDGFYCLSHKVTEGEDQYRLEKLVL